MSKIHLNGIDIYYELHGERNLPVLVLNNGIIMNASTSWAFQTKTLAKHCQVLQYDMRGQGQSSHPDQPYSMQNHADDLAYLLEALDIPQAHIAGISYGGEVAQAFCLQYPEKTRSLLLIDTVSEVGDELRIVMENWRDALISGSPVAFFNATVPWNFSPTFIRRNGPLLEDAKKRYALLDFPAIIRLIDSFLQVDFTAQLHQISVPTCIMVGEKDILKGPDYGKIIHRSIPQAEYHEIPGAGHAACWENPTVFNQVILDFLTAQI